MNRVIRAPWRAAALLLALCLALVPGIAWASRPAQPTLASNADTYDPDQPEILSPDMLIATAAILVDASSGEVLFEKNADQVMYPASTTKIMTALLAMQFGELSLGEPVTVSYHAVNQPSDSQTIPLSEGEQIRLIDLIYATMLRSGNDGAIALAEYISGSEAAFVDLMNRTALFFGCTNTHFANPHGLHDDYHYTTARDLSIIAMQAMNTPRFRDLAASADYTLPATNTHPARTVVSNNLTLQRSNENRFYSADSIGVKTGYTDAAMNCFVGTSRRGGVEMISVVLYTSDNGRWTDTQKLMDYGFTQVVSVDPMMVYRENPRILNITGFDLTDANQGQLELDIRPVDPDYDVYIVGRKTSIDEMTQNFGRLTQIQTVRNDRAPVEAGETMATLVFYPKEGPAAEYELFATRSIAARKDAPPTLADIYTYTMEDPNPLPRFSLEFVLPPAILVALLALLIHRLRHRKRRARRQQRRVPLPRGRYYR